ncbi:MAG: iron ABC transporter permease [archaeon]|nr:iron ABC transporter permease [archaeon]
MNFDNVRSKLRRFIDGDGTTHVQIRRHRSRFLALWGTVIIVVMVLASLCLGPTKVLNPIEAVSALFNAIASGGQNLGPNEFTIYHDRLPRTIAGIAVGMGLAIAGSIYQAVIRNPLVDPYIMGVSAGAGTAAISVIAFDFTLFGLLSPHSVYLTAITAMIGGLIAFGITTLVAERAGGTTNSYVLAGVVVGLAFSAIQTVMIVFAGNELNNALLWLFGSFASVTFEKAIPVIIVSVILCVLSMKWAKELNLMLLGEDQARQMGLDAHRFSVYMLILASVLTSVCVAFVGIIGFVGLVIPHLCRMLFGGDHRLVMPASMAFGAALMVAADILSRMVLPGEELPVGAITTLIGVPVFAYLLFKRGKIYNG